VKALTLRHTRGTGAGEFLVYRSGNFFLQQGVWAECADNQDESAHRIYTGFPNRTGGRTFRVLEGGNDIARVYMEPPTEGEPGPYDQAIIHQLHTAPVGAGEIIVQFESQAAGPVNNWLEAHSTQPATQSRAVAREFGL
jgi:hypothetical protein